MRYFKVTDGQMRSLYYVNYHGRGVQYKLGELVYPQVGKFFCYSLEHLNRLGFGEYQTNWYSSGERRLFECECDTPKSEVVYCKLPVLLHEVHVGKLDTTQSRHQRNWSDCTVNTILARGIKLVKELTIDDLKELIGQYVVRSEECTSK